MFLATKWGIKDEILACSARFERATYALEGRKLISYKRLFMAVFCHSEL